MVRYFYFFFAEILFIAFIFRSTHPAKDGCGIVRIFNIELCQEIPLFGDNQDVVAGYESYGQKHKYPHKMKYQGNTRDDTDTTEVEGVS